MATAIYHGFIMLGLATMLGNGQKGTLTPSGFVLGWCLTFDAACLLALGAFIGNTIFG